MSTAQPNITDRGFSITAVERKTAQKHIDIFICGDDGNVYTAWWDEGRAWSTAIRQPHWRRWRNLESRNFPPRAPVAAVSRTPDKLDIFVCANDHHVYTKWWSPHGKWSDGWFDLGGAGEHGDLFAPGTEITAVTRASEKIDLFGSAITGDVYKCWWSGGKGCLGWSSLAQRLGARWTNFGGRRFRKSAAANVAVVVRDELSMDAFFCDDEGHVLHKIWHGKSTGHWDEHWQDIGGEKLSPGGHISAVSRKPTQIDLYACGIDGSVYTSWWTQDWGWPGINNGSWTFLGGDHFAPGAPISAVAVNGDHLDIGTLDGRGSLHRKWWDKEGNRWHTWNVLEGSAVPGSQTASLSVSSTRIDTFIVRSNGEVFTMKLEVSSNMTTWNHWTSIGTLPSPSYATSSQPLRPLPFRDSPSDVSSSPSTPLPSKTAPDGELMSSDKLRTLQYQREKTDEWFETMADLQTKYKLEYSPKKALKVAVLDSGIDLNGCWRFDEYEKARVRGMKSFIDDQPQTDKTGHGSRIAAIILRLTTNVDLYIAKVTNTKGVCQEEAIKALKYVRDTWNVDVISMSLGFDKHPCHELYNEFEKCVNAGITIFASASNEGGNNQRSWPARSSRALCIYSATWEGIGSDFNPPVERANPGSRGQVENFTTVGEEIRPIWPLHNPGVSQLKYESGTSFVTPVAVSIAAFMIAYIEKKWPDYNWIIKPSSTEGIRNIFYLISKDMHRYDWLSPTRYLSVTEEDEIFTSLKHLLDCW